MSRNAWAVICAILAVIIAWIVVDLVFSLLWFIGKLVIVALVAVVVFFLLRSLIGRRSPER
ncbi:hypothetical protein [Agrococcus baldri]|uniref:Flagellar biosynthesis protein FlhA n=1 Tax=Agrococcus baldri TaxID=153730 RepID=A0AA87REH4_9MICO|nr:hypothetical protein [Agrococcus baldri]GEK81232.1 hypothetical protein ABA31_25830 [Agrococcus baldri]